MTSPTILTDNKWKLDLRKRKYMGLFLVPRQVFEATNVNDGTKRLLSFKFNTAIKLRGTASITSGREISIPKHLQHYFEEADWFECEILDNTLYEKVTLDIY
ncbi:MAG: hypothetical protein IPM14_05275 [bacterium]|nr:hypothetical protein [bacterium]